MKATLYEALGISPTASDEDVRASLRRLIRKYYTKTRDGHGNVEEALRFINHASRILSDPDRRRRYDQELAVSAGTTEQKIDHVVSHAVAEAGEQTDVREATADAEPVRALEASLDAAMDPALVDLPEQERARMHHPGLTERVATFGRSPVVTLALCVAVRCVHRRGDHLRDARRYRLRGAAGAGLGDAGADRARRGVRHRARGRLRAPAHGAGRFRAAAADRSRDPELAPREERVHGHQPAAGGCELDLPAAHGGARARQVRAHQRAATVAQARRAALRLCDLGTRRSRCCCPSCAACTSSPTPWASGWGTRCSRR